MTRISLTYVRRARRGFPPRCPAERVVCCGERAKVQVIQKSSCASQRGIGIGASTFVGVLFDFQIYFIIVVVVIMINQRHMERVLFLPFIVIVWDRCATTDSGRREVTPIDEQRAAREPKQRTVRCDLIKGSVSCHKSSSAGRG